MNRAEIYRSAASLVERERRYDAPIHRCGGGTMEKLMFPYWFGWPSWGRGYRARALALHFMATMVEAGDA